MRHIIKFEGEVIGSVLTNHSMTEEEILYFADIQIAKTEDDFLGMPENGMYDFNDLVFEEEI